MVVSTAVVYRVDEQDRITDVNEAWVEFAEANDGQALRAPGILGRPLWEFLADPTTIQLYQTMLQRLRQGAQPIRFRFRCDAAARRRLLEMEIAAQSAGAVRFSVTSVLEQARPPAPLLDRRRTRDERVVVMCGWCKRVEVSADEWAEVEDALPALGLFDGAPLPELSHGMCAACFTKIVGTLDSAPAGAATIVTVGALDADTRST